MTLHDCHNELRVSGPPRQIAEFLRGGETDDELLSLDRLLPEPDIGMLGGDRGWCNWRVTHWGSKWDASDIERSQSRHGLVYHFQTAWLPPVNPVREASRHRSDLTFELSYASDGDGYAGRVLLRGGCVLEENSGSHADVTLSDASGRRDQLRGSLSSACRELPEPASRQTAAALRDLLRDGGARSVEDLDQFLLSLGDPDLVREHARSLDRDALWELLTTAVGDLRGGTVLLALRADGGPAALLARSASHFQGALVEPGLLVDAGHRRASCERISLLRSALETAEESGDLPGFVDTCEGLARNWVGDDLGEFLDAAQRLHF